MPKGNSPRLFKQWLPKVAPELICKQIDRNRAQAENARWRGNLSHDRRYP